MLSGLLVMACHTGALLNISVLLLMVVTIRREFLIAGEIEVAPSDRIKGGVSPSSFGPWSRAPLWRL
jgi:hypothetical protein